MKSVTAYALALEMADSLMGCRIEAVHAFVSGATIEISGAPSRYLHLFYFGKEPELIAGRAPIIPPERAREALRPIWGARITGVRPLGMGRVLVLSIEGAGSFAGPAHSLLRLDLSPGGKTASLFAAEGGGAMEMLGADRSRAPASAESVPAQKMLTLLELPEDPPRGLSDAMANDADPSLAEETTTLAAAARAQRWLVDTVEGMDPILAHGITRGARSGPVAVWEALRELAQPLRGAEWSWTSYRFRRRDETVLYPIVLPFGEREQTFASWTDATEQQGESRIVPGYVDYLKRMITARYRKDIERTARIVERVSEDISTAEQAKEYRDRGNLLVAHRHRLRRGMKEIEVTDFSGERTVVIPLDPAKGPDDNITQYFKRAKKGDRGILVLRARRSAVETELGRMKRALERVRGMSDPSELITMLPTRPMRHQKRREAGAPRFRRFDLGNGLVALVGKSDEENDELTHRHASPSDLWFHAQGVAGSHVVLKGADRSTPKRLLERAAAIAAYFSKARHSTTVPVMYAEKRYVRKPRNSKPGTAVCQRSKTLFVRPYLPEEDK